MLLLSIMYLELQSFHQFSEAFILKYGEQLVVWGCELYNFPHNCFVLFTAHSSIKASNLCLSCRLSFHHIAPKTFVRLSLNLAGVLLLTKRCSFCAFTAVWNVLFWAGGSTAKNVIVIYFSTLINIDTYPNIYYFANAVHSKSILTKDYTLCILIRCQVLIYGIKELFFEKCSEVK